jgi:hypothetical protein
MKWYSVSKYEPSEAYCVLRLQNKHNSDITCFTIGYYSANLKKWIIYGEEIYEENYYLTPTHFMLIPPVEIEE